MTKTVKPIQTEHTTSWHWWAFSDFCKLKAEVREPSPHMQMIGLLAENKSIEEIVWLSSLYAAFYNIPSALAMWQEWPWERAVSEPKVIKYWLQENWKGLSTRVERRAVRTVSNMAECLVSLVNWSKDSVPSYLTMPNDNGCYDFIWQETDSQLRFMGRYIIIRLLEALHRFCGLQPHLYDIRSIGGWSPKRALGLLYPEQLDLLLSPDTKENVKKVDTLAFSTIEKLGSEFGLETSPYVFAAMLCEYRVAYENRKQYSGWTIDQEPAYWYKIRDYWQLQDIEDKFFDVRKRLFPNVCLGELNGWRDTRIEPRRVLRDYGYNWTDLKYDFSQTTDFSNPVLR